MINYMVFDALCEIFENHNIIKKRIPHKKKMKFLCDKLNIEYKSETFEKIVEISRYFALMSHFGS